VAKLTNLVHAWNVVIDIHPKLMRTNLELVERDPEGMHQVKKCVGSFENEAVPHLYKMLCVEGHLGFELMGGSTQVT
jgi:hypothetical protein